MQRYVSTWESLDNEDIYNFALFIEPACGATVRWADIAAPCVVITESAPQSCTWVVRWGDQVRWGRRFTSIDEAKRAVDARLRQLGYVLPEDKTPTATASPEPRVGPELAVCRAALADVTATLADRTKERDALLNNTWYGPWVAADETDPATSEGVEMIRHLSTGFRLSAKSRGCVVWEAEDGWHHTPRLSSVSTPATSMTLAMQAADQALVQMDPGNYLVGGPYQAPNPALIWCPKCETVHVDEGELAWRPHRTHECVKCKHTWPAGGPGEFWVGVDPAAGKGAK